MRKRLFWSIPTMHRGKTKSLGAMNMWRRLMSRQHVTCAAVQCSTIHSQQTLLAHAYTQTNSNWMLNTFWTGQFYQCHTYVFFFFYKRVKRLPKQKGNFQSNSLFGGHKSILWHCQILKYTFYEASCKFENRNFPMFKISKFSIYIVFEVAKTSGTWEHSHVELCTTARFKQGFRCWTQHEFTLFWKTNIWILPCSLLMWYLSLKQSHGNYFHMFPVGIKSAMTNCNMGSLYEECYS